ncbi:MAG: aspartyl/glutamyl-tRNA amidotransferase subunit C [Candidatus Babeliaceae bacterium]|nr:aspartyl/glutamyl-tRNA amidotransferase subunit C [Candidatus Babeliaceae bacterium]
MTRVTEDEVLHLGYLARIKLNPDEIPALAKEIEAVLEYADFLVELAKSAPTPETQGTPSDNIMRDDSIERQNPEPLLTLAPQREADYFVVPRIISRS